MVHHFSFMKASQDYVRRQGQGNAQPAVSALFRQVRFCVQLFHRLLRLC